MMNATKWRELRNAVQTRLPFAPAFQRKDILRNGPYPKAFDEDVWYYGDWSAGTDSSLEIEWLRVRPRILKRRGALVSPEVIDIESQFVALWSELGIPFRKESGVVQIYGYTNDTSKLGS